MDQYHHNTEPGQVSAVIKIGLVVLAAVSVAYAIQGAYRAQMAKSMELRNSPNEEVTSVGRSVHPGNKEDGLYQPQSLPRLELNVDSVEKPKMSTEEAMKRMSKSGELQEISHHQFEMLADEMHLMRGKADEGEYPTPEEFEEIRRKGYIIR